MLQDIANINADLKECDRRRGLAAAMLDRRAEDAAFASAASAASGAQASRNHSGYQDHGTPRAWHEEQGSDDDDVSASSAQVSRSQTPFATASARPGGSADVHPLLKTLSSRIQEQMEEVQTLLADTPRLQQRASATTQVLCHTLIAPSNATKHDDPDQTMMLPEFPDPETWKFMMRCAR